MRRFNLMSFGLALSLVSLPALAQTAVSLDNNSSTSLNSGNSVDLFAPNTNPPVANLQNTDLNTGVGTREDRRVDRVTDRDIGQQEQIEQGLKSGQLTDAEAARLERGEARIDDLESRMLQNNSLTASEAARLNTDLNRQEQHIQTLENNNVTGTATSPSTQRLEADIQRDANQQQHIANDLNQGSLTANNVGTLEAGQAGNDALQANAARNGVVSINEQQNIRASENAQGAEIKSTKLGNTSNVTLNTAPTVLGTTPSNITSLNTNTASVSVLAPANGVAAAMGNSTGFTSTVATGAMGNSTGLANANTTPSTTALPAAATTVVNRSSTVVRAGGRRR